MKVALYARVSTDDKNQNPETQLRALREYCKNADWEIYQEYVDKARAMDFKHRGQWRQLQKDARQHKFKSVFVFRLDRAFRSVRECSNLVTDWKERGIAFKSLSEDIVDTTTSQGWFMLHMMAAMAELESAAIGERVRAGMARAKAEGRSLGRKSLPISFTNVCKALQGSLREGAEVNYSRAARILSTEFDRHILPGFVHIRVTREAARRNISRKDLVKEIASDGSRPHKTKVDKALVITKKQQN